MAKPTAEEMDRAVRLAQLRASGGQDGDGAVIARTLLWLDERVRLLEAVAERARGKIGFARLLAVLDAHDKEGEAPSTSWLAPGVEVEWDNAYNALEWGVVTRLDGRRWYVKKLSHRGRLASKPSEVWWPTEELHKLRPRSTP